MRLGILEPGSKVAITRFDWRIRVGGESADSGALSLLPCRGP